MNIYSETLISNNTHILNYGVDDIKRLLDMRNRNMTDPDFYMDYKELASITAFDHYICKKILNKEAIVKDSIFDIYLKEISRQIQDDPYFLFTLPISLMEFSELEKYIPNIHSVWNEYKQKREVIKVYEEEFDNFINGKGPEPKKENIEAIVSFYKYIALNKRFRDELVERQGRIANYLLSKNSTYGFQSVSFLIEYFGRKKCKELGLDETQILFGNLNKAKGISSNSDYIVINKSLMKNIRFIDNGLNENIANISKTSKTNDIDLSIEFSGFGIMKTLFHELQHQVQHKSMLNHENSDISYMCASRVIIYMYDDKEYYRNYWSNEIENDANIKGWHDVIKFARTSFNQSKKSSSDNTLLDSLEQYIYGVILSKLDVKSKIDYRRDESSKARFTSGYINEQLDKHFKNNPQSLLHDYPQFLRFYHPNGTPKTASELLLLNINAEENTYYLGQLISRINNNHTNDFSKIVNENNRPEDSIRMIKSINYVIYLLYSKLSCVKKYKTHKSLLSIDRIETTSIPVVRNNTIKYFKTIQYLVEVVKEILINNPTIITNVEFYVSNSSNGINNFLHKINSNQEIKEYIGDMTIEEIETQDLLSHQNLGGR